MDSNVIFDVVTEDPKWYEWPGGQLEKLAERHTLVINAIVYSEVSIGFDRIEDLDQSLPPDFFRRDPLPWEAGFLAGKCLVRYRRSGGKRRSPLPDFYIGAHAADARHETLPDLFPETGADFTLAFRFCSAVCIALAEKYDILVKVTAP